MILEMTFCRESPKGSAATQGAVQLSHSHLCCVLLTDLQRRRAAQRYRTAPEQLPPEKSRTGALNIKGPQFQLGLDSMSGFITDAG